MHDQNFKNLILDYPRQAVEFFAAEEATKDLDQARILPVRQEQLKERLGDRFRELDTPLLVEWEDGRREAILFVFEEETETSRFSILRLARYCLDLAELMETRQVVPVAIFLRPGKSPTSLRLGTKTGCYLEFQYLACDLGRLPAERYLESDNIVARLNLPNMQYAPDNRLQIYHAAQVGLASLEENPEKQRKYLDFIDFYAKLSDEEIACWRKRYLTQKGEIMGLAQVLIDEGRREGRDEGRREGRDEGGREGRFRIVLRLLTRRFGILPPWARQRLEAASPDLLEIWADQLLDAASLEEALREQSKESNHADCQPHL